MTEAKQRIAIAKACGWRWITDALLCGYAPWRKQYEGADIPTDGSLPFDDLPQYTQCLNAMHEAEGILNDEQRPVYGKTLAAVCNPPNLFWLAYANPEKRAEAFLRTLNLWEDAR